MQDAHRPKEVRLFYVNSNPTNSAPFMLVPKVQQQASKHLAQLFNLLLDVQCFGDDGVGVFGAVCSGNGKWLEWCYIVKMWVTAAWTGRQTGSCRALVLIASRQTLD